MKTKIIIACFAFFALSGCSKKDGITDTYIKDLKPYVIAGKIQNGAAEPVPFLLVPENDSEASVLAFGFNFTTPYSINNGSFHAKSEIAFLGTVEMTATITSSGVINPVFKASNVDTPYTISHASLQNKPQTNILQGKTFRSGPVGGYDYVRMRFSDDSLKYTSAVSGGGLWSGQADYKSLGNIGCQGLSAGTLKYAVFADGKLDAQLKINGDIYNITMTQE